MDPLEPGRKRRGDASRIDPHADIVMQWLERDGQTYAEVVAELRARGVDTSVSSLSRWYQARQREALRGRILRNITSASQATQEIRAQARAEGLPGTSEVMNYVGVLATQLSLRPETEVDPGNLGKLLAPLLEWERLKRKDRELEMDREKLELLKRKAAQAEEAGKIAGDEAAGTPEERMAKIRAIFGMAA